MTLSILYVFHGKKGLSDLGYLVVELSLPGSHLPGSLFRSLVLIADQMENAMDHQQDDHSHFIETESIGLALGCLNGYHDISEEMGMQDGELSFSHGECQDIRRFIPAEISPIQSFDLKIIDKQEAELRLKQPRFGQYLSGRLSYFSSI